MRRQGQARRGRRVVIGVALGFALSQLALAVPIDVWLDEVRDPEFAVKRDLLRQRLAEAPGRPLVLALGSSRTAYGLEAKFLSDAADPRRPVVFNVGLLGGGPFLQLTTLRRLLDDGVSPELLCVEVMPAMFGDRGGRLLEERIVDGARLRVDEVARLLPYCRRPRGLLGDWCLGRALPCYRHQAELRQYVGLDERPKDQGTEFFRQVDAHGWACRGETPTAEELRKGAWLARQQYAGVCGSSQFHDGPARAVEALLTLARRERIPVLLVVMPEGSEFRAMYSAELNAHVAALLERWRNTFGASVADARAWVPDSGFWDTHHLLASGARKFSERFGREVLGAALAQRAAGTAR